MVRGLIVQSFSKYFFHRSSFSQVFQRLFRSRWQDTSLIRLWILLLMIKLQCTADSFSGAATDLEEMLIFSSLQKLWWNQSIQSSLHAVFNKSPFTHDSYYFSLRLLSQPPIVFCSKVKYILVILIDALALIGASPKLSIITNECLNTWSQNAPDKFTPHSCSTSFWSNW